VGEGESPAHAPRFPYRLGTHGTVWGFGLKVEKCSLILSAMQKRPKSHALYVCMTEFYINLDRCPPPLPLLLVGTVSGSIQTGKHWIGEKKAKQYTRVLVATFHRCVIPLLTKCSTNSVLSLGCIGCIGEDRARIPSPLPLRVAKTGRNHLNEEFTPLLPTGIGERF
jgi:hypothetical protein